VKPPLAIVQHLNREYERAVEAHDAALSSPDELLTIAKEAEAADQLTRALRCARRVLTLSPGHEGRAAAVVAFLRRVNRHEEALDVMRAFKGTLFDPLVTTGAATLCDQERWELAHKTLARLFVDGRRPSPEAHAVKRRIEAARPDLRGKY
jgi:hypothetical protein